MLSAAHLSICTLVPQHRPDTSSAGSRLCQRGGGSRTSESTDLRRPRSTKLGNPEISNRSVEYLGTPLGACQTGRLLRHDAPSLTVRSPFTTYAERSILLTSNMWSAVRLTNTGCEVRRKRSCCAPGDRRRTPTDCLSRADRKNCLLRPASRLSTEKIAAGDPSND